MRTLFIAVTSGFLVAGALTLLSGTAQATGAGCVNSSLLVSGGAYVVDDGLGLFGVSCSLPTTGGGASSRWDTKFSIGIAFSFGSGDKSPDGGFHITGGVRRTNTNLDGRVDGGELHASINPIKWTDIQVRGMGLYGDRDILGNAGLGWDFGSKEPLVALGVQLPYTRILGDYHTRSGNVRAFIEANSYGRLKSVNQTGTACSAGTLVNETSGASFLSSAFASITAAPLYTGGLHTGQILTDITDATSYASINGTATTNWLSGQTCLAIAGP